MLCYDIANLATAWTALAPVLEDSAESVSPGIFIDQISFDLYATYARGTAVDSQLNSFYKKSDDGGATWGAETALAEGAEDDLKGVWTGNCGCNDGGRFMPAWFNDDLNTLITNKVNSVEIVPVPVAAERDGKHMGWLGGLRFGRIK